MEILKNNLIILLVARSCYHTTWWRGGTRNWRIIPTLSQAAERYYLFRSVL